MKTRLNLISLVIEGTTMREEITIQMEGEEIVTW